MSALAAIFVCLQWYEMHQGVDTHALADAATDQADATQQFSDTAEEINNRMSDAVDQLTTATDNAKVRHSSNSGGDAIGSGSLAWNIAGLHTVCRQCTNQPLTVASDDDGGFFDINADKDGPIFQRECLCGRKRGPVVESLRHLREDHSRRNARRCYCPLPPAQDQMGPFLAGDRR
jgi:hypothetical protein